MKVGDLIEVGYNSNYGQQKNVKYMFLTATLDAAIWGLNLLLVTDKKEFIWWSQQENYLDKFQSGFTNSKTKRLETSGHFPQEEQSEIVAREIMEFLK